MSLTSSLSRLQERKDHLQLGHLKGHAVTQARPARLVMGDLLVLSEPQEALAVAALALADSNTAAAAAAATAHSIEKVYSQLQALGFAAADVEAAIAATGGGRGGSEGPALDWLLTRVPEARVPPALVAPRRRSKGRAAEKAAAADDDAKIEIVPTAKILGSRAGGPRKEEEEEAVVVPQDPSDWVLPDEFVVAPSPPPPLQQQQKKPTAKTKEQPQQQQQQKKKKETAGRPLAELKPPPEEPLLPPSWTGKTPASMLHEWLQRRHRPRPEYMNDRAPNGLVRLKVRVTVADGKDAPTEVIDSDTAFKEAPSAKNAVATAALHRLAPTEPLYRMMPPYFRSLWLGWDAERSNAEAAAKKQQKMQRSAFAASLKSSTPSQPQQQQQQQQPPRRTSPPPKAKTPPPKEAHRRTEKQLADLSASLHEAWTVKQSSGRYKASVAARALLPAWAVREQIVSTISTNAVTVVVGAPGCGAIFPYNYQC